MRRILYGTLALAATFAVACSDTTTPSRPSATALASAFLSTPAGFGAVQSSYPASSDAGMPWMPEREGRRDGGGMDGGMGALGGPGGRPDGDMMGGGLRPEFFGGFGLFGVGMVRRPFDDDDEDNTSACTFDSVTGRITCAPVTTPRGLTITRSMAFTDAAGNAQQRPDSTTDKVNVRIEVSGTVTRRDSATATVAHTSDRTVSGLAKGSTARSVSGTSAGTESISGKSPVGAFTARRIAGDTITGVVIPLQDGWPTYPTAGTVIRLMQVTLTLEGQAPKTSSRREVVTYDGSNTAKVEITHDGQTKSCTLPLPRGRLSCP